MKVSSNAAQVAQQLSELEPNWDSYGGPPPDARALAKAVGLLHGLHLVPRSDGGVDISTSFDGCEIEVGVDPDGRATAIIFEQSMPRQPPEESGTG